MSQANIFKLTIHKKKHSVNILKSYRNIYFFLNPLSIVLILLYLKWVYFNQINLL